MVLVGWEVVVMVDWVVMMMVIGHMGRWMALGDKDSKQILFCFLHIRMLMYARSSTHNNIMENIFFNLFMLGKVTSISFLKLRF